MTHAPFDQRVDYYRLMGVKTDATPEQIHAAYRRLARAYHPDIHPGSSAAIARMARLNVAKSVLLDGSTRAAYDLSRRHVHDSGCAVRPPTATPEGGRSFDRNAALTLFIVAPLVVALLVYVVTGAQVAAQPTPFLVC
jgi:curved DNA-binding protein CbpA